MPYLFSPDGGVNRKIKTLYVPDGGVNRKLKSLYAPDGGINRKIFSGADCQAIAYKGCVVGEDTSFSGSFSVANGSVDLILALLFENPVNYTAGQEVLRIEHLHINASSSDFVISKTSFPSPLIARYPSTGDLPSTGGYTYEYTASFIPTYSGSTNAFYVFVGNMYDDTNNMSITVPAGNMYLNGSLLNGFEI